MKSYLAGVQTRKQEKVERGEFIELEVPSTATTGLKFKILPIQLEQFTIAGQLPMSLVGRLNSVRNLPSEEIQKRVSEEDLQIAGIRTLEMVASILLNNLVFPRITLEPTDDSITPEQLDPEDFDFLMNWILNRGGTADADLKSPKHSGKRRRAA